MDREPLPLTIDVTEADGYAVITPRGYLNALTGDQIDKVCDSLVSRGYKYVIINFGQVNMINTIGISILVGIIEKVINCKGLVYFTELGGTNYEIFEVLNLTTVALIFPTDEAALDHIARDRDFGLGHGEVMGNGG